MTQRARKIKVKFKIDSKAADALLAAGFTGTSKVHRALDAELLAVRGVGPAMLEKLRHR